MAKINRTRATVAILVAGLATVVVWKATSGRRRFAPPWRLAPESGQDYIVHKVPEVPIEIDGVSAEPQEIKNYDGRPLYYVVDQKSRQDEVLLRVFSTEDKLHERLRESAQDEAARSDRTGRTFSGEAAPPEIPSGFTLWQHVGYGGDSVTFDYEENVPDFRSVDCFLWWCDNWNDRASSVGVPVNLGEPQPNYYILHEHINYQGSQLWIPAGWFYEDLVRLGWNDRASSLSYTWGDPR
jgi:hypothetical protein